MKMAVLSYNTLLKTRTISNSFEIEKSQKNNKKVVDKLETM